MAVEAIDFTKLCQFRVMYEMYQLPVAEFKDLLRLLLVGHVADHDLTVARQETLVGHQGEVRDEMLWDRTLHR